MCDVHLLHLKRAPLDDRKCLFAYERVGRARAAEFEINRTAGANATLKMTNPEEIAAPRTRVTLFRGVHPFQSTDTSAWYTRLRTVADARRITNFTPKTNHLVPVVWCSTVSVSFGIIRMPAGMRTSTWRPWMRMPPFSPIDNCIAHKVQYTLALHVFNVDILSLRKYIFTEKKII